MRTRPFSAADVPAAGRLLAARHAAHRRREPLLPARYEQAGAAEAEVAALWSRDGASGAVLLGGDLPVGFLLGAPRADGALWVELAGLAADGPGALRLLYAAAAGRWAHEGHREHLALVPAGDPAVADAWWRLGFGLQHVHAVRPPQAWPTAAGVRPARVEDVRVLAELELLLPQHQALAPVFSSLAVPDVVEAVAEWEDTLADPRCTAFVAERDGAVVGAALSVPVEMSRGHSGLARLDGAVLFAFAAVRPEQRGTGVGRALGQAVLDAAHHAGVPAVVTDWRSTNVTSSRAWSGLGYRETFWRVQRTV